MLQVLTRNWWVMVLRGVAAILFGLGAFFLPSLTLLALVTLFGAYALLDGAFALVAAIKGAKRGVYWWALLFEGIAGIAAGVLTFIWPGITAVVLLFLIAGWAIVTGILEIIAAVRLRREIEGEWILALGGVISIAFGVYLAVLPGAGALALIWIIGAYALAFGILLIALGIRLRSRRDRVTVRVTRSQQARAS